ncbi:hypothetical protein GE061_006480 [Apolygus lucorum]|uniref:Uncharacterized protein n=1 Tax=Apolygus lucorum TaxID=248454 RepID=A0A6A4J0V9_APOLU|nr:hypothetical protein GE061_006480 [Apolygus lucorum]
MEISEEILDQEMSGCPRFKQNAWKKELCSNCYRPKEEHKSKKTQKEPPILILKPAAQGILSLGSKKSSKKKKKCVRFTKEESEVIGFGGLEASDSEEDDDFEFEKSEQPTPLEREVAGEEEKALERLTKCNTDFNSSLKNLCGVGGTPKTVSSSAPTQNGKQQKQTLQVTIQPFSSTSIAASRKSHLNKLLEEEDPKPAILNGSPKEILKTPKEVDRNGVKEDSNKERPKETSKTKLELKEELQNMPNIKTIVIEPKKEERGTPEGRKTHIQRGSIVTKAHEQAKNKLCVQNGQKSEKSSTEDNEDYEDIKTIIITGMSVEEKNEKNLKESIEEQVEVESTKVKIEQEEVTVKVLKLLNGQNGPPESREMAGEPDGKADSDEHEHQETPIAPPPRSSFLHRENMNAPEKPPKPAVYSSTTDLKSKPIYQTPPEIKPPPRPTSLLNLTTSDKKEPILNSSTTPDVKRSILNGSSPDFKAVLNDASPDSKLLNGSSPELKMSLLNGSTPDLKKTLIQNGSPDMKKTFILNGASPDLKTSLMNGSSPDLNGSPPELKKSILNGSTPEINRSSLNGVSPEPKKTSFFQATPKKPPKTSPLNGLTDVIVSHQIPTPRSPSSPDGKSVKSLTMTSEVKTSRASSMFNSLSSEIRSFKSFLSSPLEGKHSKGSAPGLPPTPLTLARSVSPPPALPMTPPPSAPSPTASAPSPSMSSTSSSTISSSKRPPSPCSPSSSLGSTSTPPLPTTPPPQPTGLPPPLILNGTTAAPPALAPLQINTQLHLPLTPSDDIPVLQEVCARKRPAPKPPVSDIPPEPLPRRRNSSEANSSGTGTEKKKTRVRATLRKLLRFGSREEEPVKVEDEPPAIPRPRPQIIHPLDLNKSAVQVLPPHSMEKSSPDSSISGGPIYHSSSRPSKPPPPPRSESLNLMERLRPRDSPSSNTGDNVYANLGEGRCGITPVKPQRTGSMRDAQAQKPPAPTDPSKAPVYQNEDTLSKSCSSQNESRVFSYQNDTDHVYECVGVSSTPEKPAKSKTLPQPPSSSGSPTSSSEEEIYYPYVTFQNGECKTVMKKRGVVTKSLEENYGAVVIANLEALAHLLKQLSERKPEVPSVVQAATNLTWSSFEVAEGVPSFVNSFSFIDASLDGLEITLAVSGGSQVLPDSLGSWRMFKDLVAEPFVTSNDNHQREIALLKRCTVEKFATFAKSIQKTVDSVREGVHLLLQIVKFMVADETCMTSVDSSSFVVLTYGSSQQRHKAVYLPPVGEEKTNCHDAALFLSQELLGELALGKVLSRCRLHEMPNVLETWLWGPATSLPLQAIKRWLDLERANLLQSLVRATPSEDLDLHHLSFLVHTSAARIAEANDIIHS